MFSTAAFAKVQLHSSLPWFHFLTTAADVRSDHAAKTRFYHVLLGQYVQAVL